MIPPDQRRVKINNDIINMCGIHSGMIEGCLSSTIPGQKDAFTINLMISEDQFQSPEKFLQEQKISNRGELRKQIAKYILQFIKWRKQGEGTRSTLPSGGYIAERIRADGNHS
jgi:hypothetical protein